MKRNGWKVNNKTIVMNVTTLGKDKSITWGELKKIVKSL